MDIGLNQGGTVEYCYIWLGITEPSVTYLFQRGQKLVHEDKSSEALSYCLKAQLFLRTTNKKCFSCDDMWVNSWIIEDTGLFYYPWSIQITLNFFSLRSETLPCNCAGLAALYWALTYPFIFLTSQLLYQLFIDRLTSPKYYSRLCLFIRDSFWQFEI